MSTKKSSRRQFLRWSGLATAGTLLAACQPSDAAIFISNLNLEKELFGKIGFLFGLR